MCQTFDAGSRRLTVFLHYQLQRFNMHLSTDGVKQTMDNDMFVVLPTINYKGQNYSRNQNTNFCRNQSRMGVKVKIMIVSMIYH